MPNKMDGVSTNLYLLQMSKTRPKVSSSTMPSKLKSRSWLSLEPTPSITKRLR